MTDDLASLNFEAEEYDLDASAEMFSWQTDPRSLLEELEEAWDDADEDLDLAF